MAQTAADRRRAAKKAAATRKRKAKEADSASDEQETQNEASEDDAAEQPQTAEYQPRHAPLENAGLDQHDAEEKRQAELAEERKVHNVRTGNPSAPEGFKY